MPKKYPGGAVRTQGKSYKNRKCKISLRPHITTPHRAFLHQGTSQKTKGELYDNIQDIKSKQYT